MCGNADEIALENKAKMLEGYSKEKREVKSSSVQMDGGSSNINKKSHTSPTHTREQVAKMSGVGTGTIARYNRVMKSDDEELKRKVQTGEADVMEWMINTQLGRRNLPPAQRLAVMDKFKKKIQEQASIKANESRSKFHGNQHIEVCSPNGDHTKIKTNKEIAKLAGVGTGTTCYYKN